MLNRDRMRKGAYAVLVLILILMFQNCSGGFKTMPQDSLSQDLSSSAAPAPIPPDVPIDPNASLSVYMRNAGEVEQGQDLVFKIELNKAATQNVEVTLAVPTGTSIEGLHFEALTTLKYIIPAGALDTVVRVKTKMFADTESKTLKLTLTSVSIGILAQAEGLGVIKGSLPATTPEPVPTPTPTPTPTPVNPILQVIPSLNQGQCIVMPERTVKCYTSVNAPGFTLNGLSNVKMLAMGLSVSCALTFDGLVKCWNADRTNSSPKLTEIKTIDGMDSIVGSYRNAFCVHHGQTKKVFCWQLGSAAGKIVMPFISPTFEISSPQEVPGLGSVESVKLATDYGCGLLADGRVKCWGDYISEDDMRGIGKVSTSASAIFIPDLVNIKKLELGSNHGCVIDTSSQVKCWGADYGLGTPNGIYGTLGTGTGSEKKPKAISLLEGTTALALGQYHSCALDKFGKMKCWGDGFVTGTGDGRDIRVLYPKEIVSELKFTAISAFHITCGITTDNKGVCIWPYENTPILELK